MQEKHQSVSPTHLLSGVGNLSRKPSVFLFALLQHWKSSESFCYSNVTVMLLKFVIFLNRTPQVLLYIQILANSNTSPNTNIANTESHLTDLCTHVSLPHSELLLVRQKDARIWNEQMIVLMGAKCLRNIPKINSNVKNLSHWFWPRRKDSSKTELRMISTAYIFISSSASDFRGLPLILIW